MVIAAAAAAAVVIAGGVYLATSGGDGDKQPVAHASTDGKAPTGSPTVDEGDGDGDGREADDDLNAGRKPGEAKVLWLQKNDVDLPRNGADVYGPWVAGDTVVRGMYRAVSGYSAADGKQKWTLKLPADLCAAPAQTTTDGKIVIGVKNGTTDKADCSDLQMIDLNTGTAGWKKSITKNGSGIRCRTFPSPSARTPSRSAGQATSTHSESATARSCSASRQGTASRSLSPAAPS